MQAWIHTIIILSSVVDGFVHVGDATISEQVTDDVNCFLQVSQTLDLARHSAPKGMLQSSTSIWTPAVQFLAGDNWYQQNATLFWMGILVASVCIALLPLIIYDLNMIVYGRQPSAAEKGSDAATCPSVEDYTAPKSTSEQYTSAFEIPKMSLSLIITLTLPDFYHGALLSSFMPYLLVEEGPRMAGSASVFMGSAKAVFAISVALLPAFGQFSDRWVAATSHAVGRRFALMLGLLGCTLGTYGCAITSQLRWVLSYYLSVFLMRLGTDCFNVANEALVLELIPQSQFDIASGLKGAMFFIGSVLSYLVILYMKLVPVQLYMFYSVVALACVLPAAVFLFWNQSTPTRKHPLISEGSNSLLGALVLAYTSPVQYEENDRCFPRLCLASFVYHISLAPMFMLLLQLHDIIGMRGHSPIRTEWSYISIVSTTLGAISSIIFALQVQKNKSELAPREIRDNLLSRLKPWALGGSVLGALIPMIGLFGQPGGALRLTLMYILGGALFWCVGVVQALFQETVWMFLPEDASFANAMGFLVACHVTGVGVGSLGAGMVLEVWAIGEKSYKLTGYVVLSVICLLLAFLSIAIIPRTSSSSSAAEQAPPSSEKGS
jgi:hypothetical protein